MFQSILDFQKRIVSGYMISSVTSINVLGKELINYIFFMNARLILIADSFSKLSCYKDMIDLYVQKMTNNNFCKNIDSIMICFDCIFDSF